MPEFTRPKLKHINRVHNFELVDFTLVRALALLGKKHIRKLVLNLRKGREGAFIFGVEPYEVIAELCLDGC